MTFEQALTAEIGDVLISSFTTTDCQENDEAILIAIARHHNGLANDTGGAFYHREKKTCFCSDIQSFNFKNK